MNDHTWNNPNPRIAFVVTIDVSVKQFEGQSEFLAARGFQVDVISSPGPRLEAMRQKEITPWAVPMERDISIASDLVSLCRLWRLLRRIRPDIVVAGTPKAGLLGTLAARLAGVPYVQYVLHGLRLETTRGIKRRILIVAEWISCHAASDVRCVSPSLRARTVALGLAPAARCKIVGNGTADGVAFERFQDRAQAQPEARQVRRELGIGTETPVIGFVGRLTRDKGISELYEAFTLLRRRYSDLRLLLVGDFEMGDPVPSEVRERIAADAGVICTGFVDDVKPLYLAMDILALPSYREGFPTVILEAQAAAVPVVTTNATGAVDAIVEGETGLRIPVGDADALTAALDHLLAHADLRTAMGTAGRKWVERNFRREDLWRNLFEHYSSQLGSRHNQAIPPLNFGTSRAFDVQEHR
jgi:glycosyltransferase involved in cell wall biosynthesis